MSEYIFTLGDPVFNEETREAVFRPEVVDRLIRCRDCKWFGDVGCAIMIADETDKPTEDDYCSFAERKDGEQDEAHRNDN